jgi:hypothetical protein
VRSCDNLRLVVCLSYFPKTRLCDRVSRLRQQAERSARAQRQNGATLTETTMSNIHLPVETLDHIVDHLHDTRDALRNCCLVSKSWVPRARRHLFAEIAFRTIESLESWKKTFPDPSTSPARYAKFLFIYCPQAVTADSWIRSFSGAKYLNVSYRRLDLGRSATPSSHSTDSRPSSKPSSWTFTSFRPRRYST